MRKIAATAALVSALAACKGADVRPTAKREIDPTGVQACYKNARNLDTTLGEQEDRPIKMTLFMYVDQDGAVPVAFIHDAQNASSKALSSCLLDRAVESKYDSENTDYVRPQPFMFSRSQGRMMQLHEQPPGELDEKLAQSTLTMPAWASPTDKGYGYLLVHQYPQAIEQFRSATKAKPDDARAQRGLAEALAASGGDLKEARAAAEAAVKAAPGSVATHEALVRVCLAAKDDKCVLEQWTLATQGEIDAQGNVTKPVDPKQKAARSFELAQVQDQVKAVHSRFSVEDEKNRKQNDEKGRAEAAKQGDPTGCGKFPEGDERTVCFVKYCFGSGAKEYATRELKPIYRQDFSVGEWKVRKKSGHTEVAVQLRPKAGEAREAVWQVAVGDNVNMKPLTLDANNISGKYNACKK